MSMVMFFFHGVCALKAFSQGASQSDTMSELSNDFVDRTSCVGVRIFKCQTSLVKAGLPLHSVHEHVPLGIFQYFLLMVC